jgi:hypothetical protein
MRAAAWRSTFRADQRSVQSPMTDEQGGSNERI